MPAKVIQVKGLTAIVDFGGVRKEVSAILEPELREGEYVIVHAGVIISKMDEREALEQIKLLREVSELLGEKDEN